jgi:hypothetical protein
MRILFDQGTPYPLKQFLTGHEVSTAYELGWSELSNGKLIAAGEAGRFDLLLTTDQNLKYQQNLKNRRIAILVLPTTRWPQIRLRVTEVRKEIESIGPGEYREMQW